MKKIFALCLILFSFNCKGALADWQSDLESHFDLVDTFDHYEDFTGTRLGNVYDELPTRLPSHSGSLLIDYYSYWSQTPQSQKGVWLADFGAENRITGKSAKIDMRDHGTGTPLWNSQRGFQRLGWYVGNGSPSSGYDECYVFFRVKMPANMFPTNRPGVNQFASYSPEEPYEWTWIKFLQMSTGFSSAKVWNDEYGANSQRQFDTRYGDAEILLDFIESAGDNNYLFGLRQCNFTGDVYDNWWDSGPVFQRGKHFDQWAAVEVRYKLSSTPEAEDGEFQAWIYDESGNAIEVINQKGILYRPYSGHVSYVGAYSPYSLNPSSHKINKFVIGGNNSNGWYWWGESMESSYYVDDFIVDNNRIGPIYFELLYGQDAVKINEYSSPSSEDVNSGNEIIIEPPTNLKVN